MQQNFSQTLLLCHFTKNLKCIFVSWQQSCQEKLLTSLEKSDENDNQRILLYIEHLTQCGHCTHMHICNGVYADAALVVIM